jgi:hypothetical protein
MKISFKRKKINNMNHELKKQSKREIFIICFKIKNPPTLHSTLKIQPTTSPTFVFSVSASVRKRWVTKENCWTVVLVVLHRVFYSHFIISLKRYDMVATTFLYIIIILCYVNKLNSSMSNYGGR